MKPKNTIYAHNLNDKINKNTLKETLYLLFSQCGTVLDIVALKSAKMRGQAFIVFAELQDAVAAIQQFQSKIIFGKPMKLDYAKENGKQLSIFNGEYSTKKENVPVDMDVEEIENPSNILYVQNLPSEVSDDMLGLLFQQYEGFIQVRLVAGRTDVAYVDYQTEEQAKLAKSTLHNFLITKSKPMIIEYAQT
eukprot:NODE_223_length_12360_cov_0.266862.p4 type:complete len:192 gc:universal NODE_223_length_12360_cov_0.266862:5070-4495(-)